MELAAGDTEATVSPERGGRVSSLRVAGRELLVQPEEVDGDVTLWGLYPMVPWAGRVRDGRFTFEGEVRQLPVDAPPHALHGVGYRSAWDEVGPGHLRLVLDWPLGGTAEQRFELTSEALRLTMQVTADQPMPIVAGWHPCFRGGPVLSFPAKAMWRRDGAGIPTGELAPVPPRPWDDAFAVDGVPVLRWSDGPVVVLRSSCSTWVVYDEDPRAICVEPQTDAPDAFNRRPQVLAPGEALHLELVVDWSTRRDP